MGRLRGGEESGPQSATSQAELIPTIHAHGDLTQNEPNEQIYKDIDTTYKDIANEWMRERQADNQLIRQVRHHTHGGATHSSAAWSQSDTDAK